MTHTEAPTWTEKLGDRVPPHLEQEIEIYETQLELKRQDKIDEKVFAESRLRRGVYGQRYDNGQRHDGERSHQLPYPSGELTKGPHTMWDAPGMMRIKIPFGALDADQLELLADLAEEYSDAILHVTTRQDIQLHFVHIDDTPALMRRLAAVGITTREACGNSVRNVTACPRSGVCPDEPFDVTPYSRALAYYLLGHKDAQDFGRKFKISFSGCGEHSCGLAHMHDLGFVATVRERDGKAERGFELYVGGGLGAVPYQAKLFDGFVPEDEMLPLAQAVCRVFARLGEKRNRARARLKFLVAKLGMEEFTRLVLEEREVVPEDERWTAYLDDLEVTAEKPTRPAGASTGPAADSELTGLGSGNGNGAGGNGHAPGNGHGGGNGAFAAWRLTNALAQRQAGFAIATVSLPLGDLTSNQARDLAIIARRHNGGLLRTTVDQNVVLRWISTDDLARLHRDLAGAGLADPGAATLVDITACPGTDTCKLGISSSRGLAAELRKRIEKRNFELDEAVKNLKIKVSGCFNSCGQHHIADIGFYGVSRRVGNYTVPHFQVVLGGQSTDNAAAYGLATVAVPSKAIPDVVERITGAYVAERENGESFQDFTRRIGKAKLRALMEDLTRIPTYAEDRGYYADWGDPREYTIGDLGVGECAGEVVSVVEFGLSASERQVFEAQVLLDEGNAGEAAQKAFEAMLKAARSLNQSQNVDAREEPELVVGEFRERFHDTGLFHDPFAGPKFANYLFQRFEDGAETAPAEDAHQQIEEAQLFIEAAYSCYNRMSQTPAGV